MQSLKKYFAGVLYNTYCVIYEGLNIIHDDMWIFFLKPLRG